MSVLILPDEKRKYLAERRFQETTTDQSFRRRNEPDPFLWTGPSPAVPETDHAMTTAFLDTRPGHNAVFVLPVARGFKTTLTSAC